MSEERGNLNCYAHEAMYRDGGGEQGTKKE